MSSISTPDTGRRRYSESSAPTTPSTNRRGSNIGIDVFFKRRASSVRVRKPSYSYLVVKPRTHDDGLSSGKVLKADRWCWYCLLVLYLSFFCWIQLLYFRVKFNFEKNGPIDSHVCSISLFVVYRSSISIREFCYFQIND